MEKNYTDSSDEESIEMLEPFLQMTLKRTLERLVPDIIHRAKIDLIQTIPRRTEEIIAQKIPNIVDKIVTREIGKFQ